jgi:hypothetical protein
MEMNTRRWVVSAVVVAAAPARAQGEAEAQALRETIRGPLRRTHSPFSWEIAPVIVARAGAVSRPELRDMLVPVLVTAYEYRAAGYDRLRAAVCRDDGAMSSERARTCSTLPAEAENQWHQERRRNVWALRIALTAGYATQVAAIYLGRPTLSPGTAEFAGGAGAGLLVGSLAGGTAGWALCHPCEPDSPEMSRAKTWSAGTAIVGMIAGGVAGAAVGRAVPPGARTPVVAVGLGMIYFPFIAGTFE